MSVTNRCEKEGEAGRVPLAHLVPPAHPAPMSPGPAAHRRSKQRDRDAKQSLSKKQCLNSSRVGHVYRNCPEPLASYGILLFQVGYGRVIKYLMIRRRHTFGYVEFIRSNFSPKNETFIRKLLGEMTTQERSDIATKPFEILWKKLWLNFSDHERYMNEFMRSKANFERIIKSKMFGRACQVTPPLWNVPEWGFPKGKRNKCESDLDCAKRECCEETDIDASEYDELDIKPVEEVFEGTDDKVYRHLYFVCRARQTDRPVRVDQTNIMQMREVGDIRWCTLSEAVENIRPYNTEKITMLREVDAKIRRALVQCPHGERTDYAASRAAAPSKVESSAAAAAVVAEEVAATCAAACTAEAAAMAVLLD